MEAPCFTPIRRINPFTASDLRYDADTSLNRGVQQLSVENHSLSDVGAFLSALGVRSPSDLAGTSSRMVWVLEVTFLKCFTFYKGLLASPPAGVTIHHNWLAAVRRRFEVDVLS